MIKGTEVWLTKKTIYQNNFPSFESFLFIFFCWKPEHITL